MMRTLYFSTTFAFWLAVAAFRIALIWLPETEDSAAIAADKIISPAELARHALPSDCWMAIHGNVYDLTSYLPKHPSPPDIVLPWCGKDATEAYNTKTKGRPHSPYADELLAKYRIGTLARLNNERRIGNFAQPFRNVAAELKRGAQLSRRPCSCNRLSSLLWHECR